MSRIRIGGPGARSGRPWPGALSPGPPYPGIARGTGAGTGRAVRNGARDMTAWAGRRLWLAVRTVIRAVTMAHHEQVRMWECILLTSGGAAIRGRSSALGPVAGRVPAGRQPPASPGPGRNGAVTRAGGRPPRSRPRHRQRLLHIPGRGCGARITRSIYRAPATSSVDRHRAQSRRSGRSHSGGLSRCVTVAGHVSSARSADLAASRPKYFPSRPERVDLGTFASGSGAGARGLTVCFALRWARWPLGRLAGPEAWARVASGCESPPVVAGAVNTMAARRQPHRVFLILRGRPAAAGSKGPQS
jgi:hypothetical protein